MKPPFYVTVQLPDDILTREDYIEAVTNRFSEAMTDLVHQIARERRKPPTLIHL